MKKVILTICLFVALINSYAQTVKFGVKAGLNLTELPTSSQQQGVTVSNSYIAGYHVGGLVDIKFKSFSIQPGVLFSTKGGKSNANVNITEGGQTFTGSGTAKTTLYYIEIPLNVLYRVNTGNGNFFIGAGPYLGLGLSGKIKTSSTSGGTTTDQSQDLKFGNGAGEIQNPDFGVNGLLGYQLNSGFLVSAGYGYGLLKSSDSNGTVKNRGFSFSLGYFFK